MRIVILIAMFVGGAAYANPVPLWPTRPILLPYIDFENLAVSISSTDATFTGTFRFGEVPTKVNAGQETQVILMNFIWFPETIDGKRTYERFFKRESIRKSIYIPNSRSTREFFDNAVGMKIRVGDSETFSVVYNAPSPALVMENGRVTRLPGFTRLGIDSYLPADVVWKQIPVHISYHQPLVLTNGLGLFCYIPYLDNLPKGTSTADTNRYAITIEATPGCSLVVSNGDQETEVGSGHRLTIAPNANQPIRVTAKPTAGE